MNETTTSASGEEMLDTDNNYLAAIKELKETTVSKELFNKVKKERDDLIDTLVSGGSIEQPEKKEQSDVSALRKKLFNRDGNMSNLEYVRTALELREALIERGEPDPFLPVGSKLTPTQEEIAMAENAAQIYRECIDYADGNSEVFTNELMRRTVDVMPNRGRRSR